jgi:hypothetical protein
MVFSRSSTTSGVSFMDYDLGYIDLEEKSLQPLNNPFWPLGRKSALLTENFGLPAGLREIEISCLGSRA